mgnify:CR=1 FL=1
MRSLASYIRKLTSSNREVALFMLGTMRDDGQHMAHRLEAAKWLTDRSEGKAVERSVMLKIEAGDPRAVVAASLRDGDLSALIRRLSAGVVEGTIIPDTTAQTPDVCLEPTPNTQEGAGVVPPTVPLVEEPKD